MRSAGPDGTLEVWAVTDHPAAGGVPGLRDGLGPPAMTRCWPGRGMWRRGGDAVAVWWVKRRWKCEDERLRAQDVHRVGAAGAAAVPADGTAAGAGRGRRGRASGGSPRRRRPGVPGCHGRSRTRRSPPPRTRCWGRRPRRWRTWASTSTAGAGPGGSGTTDTGEYSLLADRWHTCFFDLSGQQGLLGQVEGRTADDAAYWLAAGHPRLAGRGPGRRDRHVHHLRLRGAPDAARRAARGGLVPRRAPGGQDDRGRAPPGGARQVRAPRPVRRPRVRHQGPAGAQPGAPVTATSSPRSPASWAAIRAGRRSPRPGSGRRNSATP